MTEVGKPERRRQMENRQQMQLPGPSPPSCSSTSNDFFLRTINTANSGSENSTELEKDEVRANNNFTDLFRMRTTVNFYIHYLLCLSLSLVCIVLVCVWNSRWRGGFAWDGSGKQFNWHPVLMVTGLVVLYGNGAVLYRIPLTWGHNKLPWKLLHAAIMLSALIMAVVGLCAVFDFHNAKGIANLYSLHSWIGIAAAALFAMQWVAGMAGFFLPCSPISLRKLLKPIHVWMGVCILVLSIAACISGINEKLFFVLTGNSSYAKLPSEGVLGNSLGVLIIAFGMVVLKILFNPDWMRPDYSQEDARYTPILQEDNE